MNLILRLPIFQELKKTNWRPKVDIKTGVSIMLKNISDWKDAPVWTPKKIEKATKIGLNI